MNLEEAKRFSNVKVITAAYLLAGLTGQQELNPSRWPALVSHFIDEIKKRTGADWLSMPKGAYEKGDSVSRESITQSEFLQLLADYPVQYATAHPQAAAPAPVAKETPAERRARWLDMFEAEEKREKRGALQRLANSEGVDRSNMGKDIAKARAERDTQRRAGGWASQLVQDGKRKG